MLTSLGSRAVPKDVSHPPSECASVSSWYSRTFAYLLGTGVASVASARPLLVPHPRVVPSWLLVTWELADGNRDSSEA